MVLYMEVRQSNAIEKLRVYYTVRANKAGKGGKGEGGGCGQVLWYSVKPEIEEHRCNLKERPFFLA